MFVSRISRREAITNGLSFAGMLFLRPASAQADKASVIVKTPTGSLAGEVANGVRVFRGVPFAQKPVGKLRFRSPRVLAPWDGTRDATRFGPAAMQPGEAKLEQSEDCLYLNIWAPATPGPHPVFVWIHGGGFTGGHAFAPIFDGSEFASQGVVVVTVAYRLGVLGFLDLEPLLGSEFRGSANNGLRDLIAALQWVHHNIEGFGGDPARVTVGGESAGAKLTDILMGTPEATPLFHQAISESGGAERIWPIDDARRVARGFGELWTKERGETNAGLQSDPAASLIRAQEKFVASWPQHFPLRCEIDGLLLQRLPVQTIAEGSTKGKRLLIGTNRDESALFVGAKPSKDATASDLGNLSAAKFREVFDGYKALYPDMSLEQRRIRALTAEEYWIPSMRVVEAHVRGGSDAWMYRLDFAPASGEFEGEAYHSLDLGLVWNKPGKKIANAGDEAKLAAQMHAAWVAFIHGKTPSAPGLPEWPRYSAANRATMVFDSTPKIEEKPQDAELQLWQGVL